MTKSNTFVAASLGVFAALAIAVTALVLTAFDPRPFPGTHAAKSAAAVSVQPPTMAQTFVKMRQANPYVAGATDVQLSRVLNDTCGNMEKGEAYTRYVAELTWSRGLDVGSQFAPSKAAYDQMVNAEITYCGARR